MTIIRLSLIISPVSTVDTFELDNKVVSSEGGKKRLKKL